MVAGAVMGSLGGILSGGQKFPGENIRKEWASPPPAAAIIFHWIFNLTFFPAIHSRNISACPRAPNGLLSGGVFQVLERDVLRRGLHLGKSGP